MRAAFYDQVYLVPVVRKTTRAQGVGAQAHLVELEFGEEYRSSRFQPGWFLLPSMAVALVCLSAMFL